MSAIKFAQNPLCVVVSDTTGDVFRLPVDKNCDLNDDLVFETYFLLGHFSLVTDLSVLGNKVATCDRDNRVRVSRFPDSFVIENFLLAHQDFVTSLDWISDVRLLSASGDGKVFVWDFTNDSVEPAAQFQLPIDPSNSTIIINAVVNPSNRDIVVVAVDNSPKLYVLMGTSRGDELKLGCVHTMRDHKPVNGAFFASDGTLWASTQDCYQIERIRVTLSQAGGNIEQVALEQIECMKLSHNEGAVSDSNAAHARTQWLKYLRRKPIVENWKGKKRKALNP